MCSWLREQHAVAGSINSLFARSLESRMKMFVINPLFIGGPKAHVPTPLETPNQSFTEGVPPLTSSTPFSGPGENSTTTADAARAQQHQPVDMMVENPIFGSGLRLKKVATSHIHFNLKQVPNVQMYGKRYFFSICSAPLQVCTILVLRDASSESGKRDFN